MDTHHNSLPFCFLVSIICGHSSAVMFQQIKANGMLMMRDMTKKCTYIYEIGKSNKNGLPLLPQSSPYFSRETITCLMGVRH